MDHVHQVSDRVVLVALRVIAHRVAIAGIEETNVWRRVRPWTVIVGWLNGGIERGASLAQVFAASRDRQTIKSVVRIISRRLDALVAEENNVLNIGCVTNARDVSDRIVLVEEFLNRPLVSCESIWPRGRERAQLESFAIVVVSDLHLIAVRDAEALAAFVVLDTDHGADVRSQRIEQARGRCRLANPDV